MSRIRFRRDAVITLVAVVLTFVALDDITTDKAESFVAERIALIACTAWFALVAWRLMRQGHGIVGGLSLHNPTAHAALSVILQISQASPAATRRTRPT